MHKLKRIIRPLQYKEPDMQLTCLPRGSVDGQALLPAPHVVHGQHPELVLRVRAE